MLCSTVKGNQVYFPQVFFSTLKTRLAFKILILIFNSWRSFFLDIKMLQILNRVWPWKIKIKSVIYQNLNTEGAISICRRDRMRKKKKHTFLKNALKGFYFKLNTKKAASTLATFSNRLLKIYLELERLIEIKICSILWHRRTE